jgi:hypothetical protein
MAGLVIADAPARARRTLSASGPRQGKPSTRPGRAVRLGEDGSTGQSTAACRVKTVRKGWSPRKGPERSGRRRAPGRGPWRRCRGRSRRGKGISGRTGRGDNRGTSGRRASRRGHETARGPWWKGGHGASRSICRSVGARPGPRVTPASPSRWRQPSVTAPRPAAWHAGKPRGPCRRACWRRQTPPN